MTRFWLRSLRSAGLCRSALARTGALGDRRGIFLALLLLGAAPGCLPNLAKPPADDKGINGEPSEVEILRADNAELSRRVHELRAEKAELKRRLALLELETAPNEPKAAETGPTFAGLSAPLPVVELDPTAQQVGTGTSVRTGQPAAQAPRPSPTEAPVLISGAAEAADFDLGRAALEAGSFQSADITLSRFLAQNPRHPFADDALVLRGRARVGRLQFDAAERDFRLVADRYPEELVAPDAWLELVRLCQTRGDDPGAREASHALLARYPDSAAASLVPQEFVE